VAPNWPSLEDVRANAARLAGHLRKTPIVPWQSDTILNCLGRKAAVSLKLELFQLTGSFKARGALTSVFALSPEERRRGITAVSAGNHAIAAAFAAKAVGTSAKIVILKSANPMRLAMARELGAEIILAENGHEGFALAEKLVGDEGRVLIHPFEGPNVTLGTATLGLEIADALPQMDALVVSIGGGGLASGVARAVKLALPGCAVYGVEPVGADSMRRSLDAGQPVSLDRIDTIADSLGAPMARPYSFELCRAHLDDVVLVDDDAIAAGAALMQVETKLAVEPAAAATAAAMLGPLRNRLKGRNVCLVVCGANIDTRTYAQLIERGHSHVGALTAA
jgi:threonine dehydratase